MSPLTGVLDAMMVIGLAKGEVFDLLPRIYDTLFIPSRVKHEVITGRGLAGETELTRALGGWITEVAPDLLLYPQFSAAPLSETDREVLAAAVMMGADHILSDDSDIRREAGRNRLTSLRTTDVLLVLKRLGLIPAVRPVLDLMRHRRFGIDPPLYERILRAAGEWPP